MQRVPAQFAAGESAFAHSLVQRPGGTPPANRAKARATSWAGPRPVNSGGGAIPTLTTRVVTPDRRCYGFGKTRVEGGHVSGPSQSSDQRDPTKWFVALLIALAVIAALIAVARYV
jgi:hypothetical protein